MALLISWQFTLGPIMIVLVAVAFRLFVRQRLIEAARRQGWRAEVDLPYGVTAAQVIDRRPQLASGLRRPLGAVWPEPVTSEHAGRLELWVGRADISKARPPTWPLLRSGQADVFGELPFGTDVRGRGVKVPMAYHNWLIGSIPRQGKTASVRVLACGAALPARRAVASRAEGIRRPRPARVLFAPVHIRHP